MIYIYAKSSRNAIFLGVYSRLFIDVGLPVMGTEVWRWEKTAWTKLDTGTALFFVFRAGKVLLKSHHETLTNNLKQILILSVALSSLYCIVAVLLNI